MATAPTSAAARPGTVARAAQDFVTAFTTLDEPRFDAFWAEDATLFFPGAVPGWGGKRYEGKAQVLEVFHRFFQDVRPRRPGPDYLGIRPADLHIQDYGDFAIVTFHLGDASTTGRRTLVMRRSGGRWRIAHMHASSVTMPVAPSPAR